MRHLVFWGNTHTFVNTKMPCNFGGVCLSNKLRFFTFRNIELVYLIEKLILQMIVNLTITFVYMRLVELLLKHFPKVLMVYLSLCVCITSKRFHPHKIHWRCNLGCGIPWKNIFQLIGVYIFILYDNMKLL